MITLSVPGKIHLLGEHVVVYGKPALLTAINLRLNLTLKKSGKFKALVNGKDYTKELQPLRKILEKYIEKKFSKKIPSYELNINSQIPIGYGLGSSGAISAALSAALFKLLKIEKSNDLIYEVALEGEKLFHGNPSGADVMAVINGAFIWFRKEGPNFKTYSSLSFPKTKGLKDFYLIDSGKPKESTKQMVELVFKRLEKERPKLEKIFIRQEELTREILIALEESNEQMLMRIIKDGQRNLEKLGVVGEKAKGIIKKVEKIGGAGKILGGGGVKGGSGMLLIYCKNKKELDSLSEQEKWNILPIQLGGEGLRYAIN